MSLKTRFLTIAIVILLIGGAFAGGFLVGRNTPAGDVVIPISTLTPPVPSSTDTATPPVTVQPTEGALTTDELFKPFWETWEIVHDQFVNQPVDDIELMRGAIRGMLEALGDPYTSYMDPFEYEQANAPLDGEYEGIGAWVDITGEYLTIISPMKDSPADKTGLKPDDQVRAVDGDDMTGVDGNLVLRRVLGPANTPVTLTIFRPSTNETFDVTIFRARITLPSVESDLLDGRIAYIQLFTFGQDTHGDMREALEELLKQEPTGLILDLRNNGGGYLNTAIMILSEFLPGRELAMIERFGDGQENQLKTVNGGIAQEIPLVVLVNEGSASASEITAGALQDYQRATLVGTQTFGKGSVQNWIPLAGKQGAVRVTIASWLTPLGRHIHKVGLTPDVIVELTDEDRDADRDPQLDKAIEILLSK